MIIFIDVNDNATAYIANINNYRNIAMPPYIARHLLVPYILQVLCNLYQTKQWTSDCIYLVTSISLV